MAFSYVQYTGNGATTNYAFSFPYLSQSHIKVRVNGVETAFTFLTSSTVQISPAPANGAIIDIRRETPKDSAPVNFADGSVLLESDLDLLAAFNLYTAQEAADGVADSITKDSLGVWQADSRRIANVDDPVDAQDVATKNWAETTGSSFVGAAAASASAAASSASAAAGSASTATTQAGIATTQAGTATTQAGIATTKANEASASATLANDWATKTASPVAGGEYSAKYHAQQAASSASAASGSATAAQTAQSAAEAARDATLTAFDNFDDRYLGAKASDPTLDNDGNALIAGSLYFNTVSQAMKVYTGSAWVLAYVSGNASSIGFTPAGNIAAVNVQAAIEELDSEKIATSAIGATVQAYDADTAKTDVVQAFTAAQRGTAVSLTSSSASIAVNLALANNFTHTTTENTTLANPSNMVQGQSGAIVITQGGTPRTMAFGSNWKFPGGAAPSLTATASAVDVLVYYVESASRITARLITDVK